MSSFGRFIVPGQPTQASAQRSGHRSVTRSRPSRSNCLQHCGCQLSNARNLSPTTTHANTCYSVYVSNIRYISRGYEDEFNFLRREEKELERKELRSEVEKDRLGKVRIEVDRVMNEMIAACEEVEQQFKDHHPGLAWMLDGSECQGP